MLGRLYRPWQIALAKIFFIGLSCTWFFNSAHSGFQLVSLFKCCNKITFADCVVWEAATTTDSGIDSNDRSLDALPKPLYFENNLCDSAPLVLPARCGYDGDRLDTFDSSYE